jgi:uncharacterized protein with HEPN domain
VGRADVGDRYGDDVVAALERLVSLCDDVAVVVAYGRESFLTDIIFQRAAEAMVQRIGESVRHRLPAELLADYPGQPWRLIVAQRIQLAHGYDLIDYEMLWATMTSSVPTLRSYVADVMLGSG